MASTWLLAAALIAGCAHRPLLYGEPVPDGCSADAPKGSEACMAWWIDRTKALDDPLLANPALERYIDRVANRVAHAAGDDRSWHVRLLDTSETQAEANVWTTLYLTRGALVRMRDEAELAGVLGHEIGHVLAGHEREAIVDHARGRESVRDLTGQRDDETQADELAVLYAAKAGYDPTAVERMLRALAAGDPPDDPDRGSDPHPRWTPRLARVQAFASQFHGGETNAAEYQDHIRGLVVGEDPRRDAVVDHALVFGTLDLAFDLPQGFVRAWASGNAVGVEFPADNDLGIHVLPARARTKVLAEAKKDSTKELAIIPAGDALLVIAGTGEARVQLVAALRAGMRRPTAAERARLIPTVLDPATKRPLWPEG